MYNQLKESFMSYQIGKGQYAGKGGKNYPINILDDNNHIIESFIVYGSHKTAKEKAQEKVNELSQ